VDFNIRISKTALTDFEEILAYSWQNFPKKAEQFGHALLNHAELLATFPYIGGPVKGRPGIRQLVHTPILIYYRVDEARRLVEILHFWHGSRRR
jgi:plasmid stabilization system protein ParE